MMSDQFNVIQRQTTNVNMKLNFSDYRHANCPVNEKYSP